MRAMAPEARRRSGWTVLALGLVAASLLVLAPGDGFVGIDLVGGRGEPVVPLMLLACAMAVPVAWARARPVIVTLVTVTAFMVQQLGGLAPTAATLAVPAACFALGRHRPGRPGTVAAVLVWVAATAVAQVSAGGAGDRWSGLVVASAVTVLPHIVGRLSATRSASGGTAEVSDGVSVPVGIPPDVSPREAEVLALVSQGLTNPEIAARLHVSRETVKSHVSSLLRKTGARDRVQLALMVHRPRDPAASTAPTAAGRSVDPPARPSPRPFP